MRADAPDLELLPDPDEGYAAYSFVGYLLQFYKAHRSWGTRYDRNFDVAVADHRDLLLLQRWIETEGAFCALESVNDRDLGWRAVADGIHIEGPSTPYQRFVNLRSALRSKARSAASNGDEARFQSHRQTVLANHLPEATAIAQEIISSLSAKEPYFEFSSDAARADLLWVVEQADETAVSNESLSQLTTALDCLTASLEALEQHHSSAGLELLSRAKGWRQRYREQLHG